MKETTIELPGLPATPEELVALRDRLATTPHGGAAILALALLAYSQDPALGTRFMTIAIEPRQLGDAPDGYKGKQPSRNVLQNLKDRIGRAPRIARSYLQGTTSANDFALPPPPWRVRVREQPGDVQAEQARVFVWSTGAGTPRPVHLVKNDKGLWKASNWSSLEVGIQAPPPAPDDI